MPGKQGFKVPRRTALLELKGGEYDGCYIRCSLDPSMDDYLFFQEVAALNADGRKPKLEEFREPLDRFGDLFLVEWNLQDKAGRPLPANGGGMLQLPVGFAALVIGEWAQAVQDAVEVSAPLAKQSAGGSMSKGRQHRRRNSSGHKS